MSVTQIADPQRMTRLAKELLACKSDAKVVGCSRNRLRSRSADYRRWFSNVFLTLLELAFDRPSSRKKSGRALRQKRLAAARRAFRKPQGAIPLADAKSDPLDIGAH